MITYSQYCYNRIYPSEGAVHREKERMMIGPLVVSSLVLLPFAVFFITLGLRGWWIFNNFGLLNWSKLHRTGMRVHGSITAHSIKTTTSHLKPPIHFSHF